jgi:hypothetical protein
MEQKALIARVQAGDRSAFADLTSRYRDMAFGYALALLRDFHLAQDVTQEAFLTAYKIQRFLSQPFFVAAPYTGRPGRFVPRAETVRACRAILAGECDHLPENALYMIGSIADASA